LGTVERRENDKQRMRKLILDTAMKLFLREGFERVTIRAIAQVIEYSPATIYLYFKDKNEILYALQTIGFEKLYQKQQEVLPSKDPWKSLRLLARIYITFALKNPEYYDLMFIMRGPIKKMKEKKRWEEGMRSYELLKTNVAACMEAGYLTRADVDVATFAFWSLTHGIASLIIRERTIMLPESRLTSIIDEVSDFVLEGMAKKPKR
jgi:AcrR family transcriptional regulator